METNQITKPGTATKTHGEGLLRLVLTLNAEFSIVTGLASLIFAGPVADLLGVDQVWLIRLLGASLLGFAAAVMFIARSTQSTLRTWSAQVSQADFAWVVGTIVVIALGWLSTNGAIVMGVIALLVGAFGAMQLRARSQMIADN